MEAQATKFDHIYFYKMCFGLQREPLARILYITVIHISAIIDLWNLGEAWTYSGYFWGKSNAAICSSIVITQIEMNPKKDSESCTALEVSFL